MDGDDELEVEVFVSLNNTTSHRDLKCIGTIHEMSKMMMRRMLKLEQTSFVGSLHKNQIMKTNPTKIILFQAFTAYNVMTNNCEHFAHWCRHGLGISCQVGFHYVD